MPLRSLVARREPWRALRGVPRTMACVQYKSPPAAISRTCPSSVLTGGFESSAIRSTDLEPKCRLSNLYVSVGVRRVRRARYARRFTRRTRCQGMEAGSVGSSNHAARIDCGRMTRQVIRHIKSRGSFHEVDSIAAQGRGRSERTVHPLGCRVVRLCALVLLVARRSR